MSDYKRVMPPLKWHGGKYYLAPKLIELMPPHIHYVEAYAGGLSVLLAKDPNGVSEVVNDLNSHLYNFWRVLQSDFAAFARKVNAVPFSEDHFKVSEMFDNPGLSGVGRAVEFFVRCRQSLAGRMKDFAPLTRNRTRGGMNEQASAWLSSVEGLLAVHTRMKRVAILNRPAVKVIEQQDGENTFFYLDPPYLHETRATTGEYEHEMSEKDHRELLNTLAGIKGKFMLSGYHSPLYDEMRVLMDWNLEEFDLPNNSASGKAKRRMTECVWMNY